MENFNKHSTSIKKWAADDRPREKLRNKGAEALSDSELLGIILNNGYKDRSAIEIAKEILRLGNNNLNELGKLSLVSLQKVKGVGEAKAITIAAALELGRRRHASVHLDKKVIRTSGDIAQYVRTMIKDYGYEVFGVLFLNQANKVNHFEIVSRGGITGTVADPRIIIRKALDVDATSIILCHNHPSGSLKPSRSDQELTIKIKEAANYLDIRVIDHLIVSEQGYYSFSDEGLM